MSYVKTRTPMLDKCIVKIVKAGEQQEDHEKDNMIKSDVEQTFPFSPPKE